VFKERDYSIPMIGACSYCVVFDVFTPFLTQCWYPPFEVALQELAGSDLPHTVGSLACGRALLQGCGLPCFTPRQNLTPLARVELSGPGKLHPGSCLDAGKLQIQLEVRARGEGRERTLHGCKKLAYSLVTWQECLSCLVPVAQASCLLPVQ